MARDRSYVVVVEGAVGAAVAQAFSPLAVDSSNGQTTISGEALDAAMLSGVLRTVERLRLVLVAVRSSVNGDSG
jgi:hypothetical protein